MPRINTALFNQIPEDSVSTYSHRPDIYFYADSRKEYIEEWQRLSQAKYLYTNGQELRPAGLIRYAWEHFKGWLGFYNHCRSHNVCLSIYKYAYYGYLRGFPNEHLQFLRQQDLDKELLKNLSTEATDQTTQLIQQQLVDYYYHHVQSIVIANHGEHIPLNHAFGRSWISLNLHHVAPSLDPQNNLVIMEAAAALVDVDPATFTYFRDSKFALALAKKKIERAKNGQDSMVGKITSSINSLLFKSPDPISLITQALELAPKIRGEEIKFFVNHHLKKKEFQAAFDLLELDRDVDGALQILLKEFSEEQIKSFIKKTSPLSNKLFEHYLKKWPRDLKISRFAQQFYPDFSSHFPSQAMQLLVEDKLYPDAYNLFSDTKGQGFHPQDLAVAADHFQSEAKLKREEAFKKIKEGRLSEALIPLAQAVVLMKKAYELQPIKTEMLFKETNREELFYIYKREYAELIIDVEMKTNSIERCNLSDVQKAVNLLTQCKPKNAEEDNVRLAALAKAMMRQIDHQMYQVMPENEYYDINQHLKNNKEAFINLIRSLEKVIAILEPIQNPKTKPLLGKAYFLIADMDYYFQLNEVNHQEYFEKAKNAVPSNPFYELRYWEITKHEPHRTKGVQGIKSLGHEVSDWMHWDGERWFKNKSYFHNIPGIHHLNREHQASSQKKIIN
nr:hypothetical protein [Legionella jordanis]